MQETQEMQVQSMGREDPLKEEMAALVFLLGKFHGQRSLVGYSPWGRKESDTTEPHSCSYNTALCINYTSIKINFQEEWDDRTFHIAAGQKLRLP